MNAHTAVISFQSLVFTLLAWLKQFIWGWKLVLQILIFSRSFWLLINQLLEACGTQTWIRALFMFFNFVFRSVYRRVACTLGEASWGYWTYRSLGHKTRLRLLLRSNSCRIIRCTLLPYNEFCLVILNWGLARFLGRPARFTAGNRQSCL